jgi:hypothetical protein
MQYAFLNQSEITAAFTFYQGFSWNTFQSQAMQRSKFTVPSMPFHSYIIEIQRLLFSDTEPRLMWNNHGSAPHLKFLSAPVFRSQVFHLRILHRVVTNRPRLTNHQYLPLTDKQKGLHLGGNTISTGRCTLRRNQFGKNGELAAPFARWH